MTYRLALNTYEEVSPTQRASAEQRYRKALEATLGDATLVAPVYCAYRRLVNTYGDAPDPDLLTEHERLVVQSWQAAETAATVAAFGENRYMGEARFEIELER
jgi:hypothetical protein